MDAILILAVVLLLLINLLLVIKLHSSCKRILEMREVTSSILDGQKKRQIF